MRNGRSCTRNRVCCARCTLPLRSPYTLFGPLPTRFALLRPASRCLLAAALRSRLPPWLYRLFDGSWDALAPPRPPPPAGRVEGPPGRPAPPTPPTPPA